MLALVCYQVEDHPVWNRDTNPEVEVVEEGGGIFQNIFLRSKDFN